MNTKVEEFKRTVKTDIERLRKLLEEQNTPSQYEIETLKLNIPQDHHYLIHMYGLTEKDAVIAILGKFKLPYQKCNCALCQHKIGE